MSVLGKIRHGKALTLLLAVAFVLFAVAFVVPQGVVETIFALAGGLVALIFAVGFLSWAKQSVGELRQYFRQVDARLKNLDPHISNAASQRNTVIEQLQARTGKSSAPANPVPADAPNNTSPFEAEAGSVYAAGAIPASSVQRSNAPGVIGRGAAAISVTSDKYQNFSAVFDSSDDRWAKRVAVIGTTELMSDLSDSVDLETLEPNQTRRAVAAPQDYVIIEEEAFNKGAWAHGLESFRLQAFLELMESLNLAKKQGAIVLVLAGAEVTTLTHSLREAADYVIGDGEDDRSQLEGLAIYAQLENYLEKESTLNV
ncbi:hypothetical protein ACEE23_02105 [Corynebacterium sp. 32222D000AT]|uniref:hypothetical protein n=1 Tax=unclassified Corynebacterium TaxID=2624378 RepID=UPI002A96DD5E|nr:hypothetical protein [Mycobacteriaceae bacterium]MDY5829681.1 hypothetical protein [Corynebacterium sp.]